jgi:YgiT-type zinc finger domain-containing protein
MICLICGQTEVMEGHTTVRFQRGEMHLTINHVPARVCPNCGEAYVNEQVAVHLLRGADEVSRIGMLEDVIEYDRFS